MDEQERRLLWNRLCHQARRGEDCVQRKATSKMVQYRGHLRHKVCAELLDKMDEQ